MHDWIIEGFLTDPRRENVMKSDATPANKASTSQCISLTMFIMEQAQQRTNHIGDYMVMPMEDKSPWGYYHTKVE